MPHSSECPLFEPYKLGDIGTLGHRVALAPLTRLRNDDDFAPRDMAVKYYAQRASTPGTLLFTEGTVVGPQAYGIKGTPGIWSDRQVEAWKKVGPFQCTGMPTNNLERRLPIASTPIAPSSSRSSGRQAPLPILLFSSAWVIHTRTPRHGTPTPHISSRAR